MAKVAARERAAFLDNRRKLLAETALRLWAEKGVAATSVAEITEAAGVSKGTFYLYFPGKQALLEHVMKEYSLLPSIQALAASITDTSFEDAVRAFVRAAWRHLATHRELVMVALRELPAQLEHLHEAIERIMVPANRMLAAYLESQLGPQRASEISLVVAGRGLIGTILIVFLTQEVLGAGRFLMVDEEHITETISQVFLHGVHGSNDKSARTSTRNTR